MSKVQFSQEHKEILDSFLLEKSEVKPGKMFGYPAYYVGEKLFASLFEEGVCVKVPESLADELLGMDHIEPFQPRGRKMKEWILINRKKSEDLLKDKDIFDESIKFVSSLTKKDDK